ncbi:hypothetical protein BJ165DRAFT_1491716 [Panaeolus papilionaceus]|nr:hypothetical protein BJ165DRAFT_1491716 [Panaeolus papilionaceus]
MDIDFGPDHEDHRRVAWPDDLESVSIQLPSSFLQHLACNTALSRLEVQKVVEFQHEIQAKERRMNEQGPNLEEESSETREQRKRVEKQRFACRVSLSPFRTLPDDILYQIVRQLPVYDLDAPITHMPTILSQVSMQWRHVVYGLPHVWQVIHVACKAGQSLLPPTSRLERFSQLSGSLPLTVTIYAKDWDADYEEESVVLEGALLDWMTTVWQDLPRLHTLDILSDANWKNLEPLLCSLGNAPSAHLQTCNFLFWNCDADRGDMAAFLRQLPSISALKMDDYLPYHIYDSLPQDMGALQSWSQLTKLYLDDSPHEPEETYLHHILELCPRLEVACLSISMATDYTTNLVPGKVVVHQHLRELGLYVELEGIDLHTALEGCCFPFVTSLHLEFSFADHLNAERLSMDDIFPSLQTLTLGRFWQVATRVPAFLVPLLRMFCNVTNLTILFSQPCSLVSLGSMGRPVLNTTERGTLAQGHSQFPNLSHLHIQFLMYNPCNFWHPDEEHIYTAWFMKTKASLATAKISVESITWSEDLILQGNQYPEFKSRRIDLQRGMSQYFSGLQKSCKENKVDIAIRTLITDRPYPWPDPLQEHFSQYFV